jgi:hypothetical protein
MNNDFTAHRPPVPVTTKERRVTGLFPGPALGQLVSGITDAIYGSFREQSMKMPTDADKRQRFAICMDWAVTLRGDLKWGVARIVGAMPEILRTTLAGGKWQPSQRQCWIPTDGR